LIQQLLHLLGESLLFKAGVVSLYLSFCLSLRRESYGANGAAQHRDTDKDRSLNGVLSATGRGGTMVRLGKVTRSGKWLKLPFGSEALLDVDENLFEVWADVAAHGDRHAANRNEGYV